MARVRTAIKKSKSMGLSLKTEHLKRYRDIGLLLLKYGRSDLVRHAQLQMALADVEPVPKVDPAESKELAADLEAMGPTFIKLGQLLSSRPDLLPQPYIAALSRLQDRVEPFPYADVERIVTAELGARMSRLFLDFDPEPTAAASLGQVHRATLRDGRAVVVKVQRPEIRTRIAEDLDALAEIVEFAADHTELGQRFALTETFDEFRKTLLRELDYRQELHHLQTLGENLREFDRIVVPAPVEDLSTSRVLTMEFIRGRKITSLSPLALAELDAKPLAEQLFNAYLKQILVDGFFHADPHPGNVFMTVDGRVALLDLGMVGRVTPSMQDELLRMVLAISEARGEEVANVTIRTGDPLPLFDEHTYRRSIAELVAQYQGATAEQIEVGKVVLEISRIASENGIRPAPELSVLGKALLNLDQVGRILDPEFDPNAAIRRNAGNIMHRRLLSRTSPANLLTTMLEMNDLVQGLPGKLNRVLDTFADNQIQIRVKVDQELWMMASMQKIANRITLGLVLAALIIGAAMLMQVDTEHTILGYPALAMVFFLIAAVSGLILAFSIVRHDPKGDADRRTHR
jgi:ubiquinone biosynthesis protein